MSAAGKLGEYPGIKFDILYDFVLQSFPNEKERKEEWKLVFFF